MADQKFQDLTVTKIRRLDIAYTQYLEEENKNNQNLKDIFCRNERQSIPHTNHEQTHIYNTIIFIPTTKINRYLSLLNSSIRSKNYWVRGFRSVRFRLSIPVFYM